MRLWWLRFTTAAGAFLRNCTIRFSSFTSPPRKMAVASVWPRLIRSCSGTMARWNLNPRKARVQFSASAFPFRRIKFARSTTVMPMRCPSVGTNGSRPKRNVISFASVNSALDPRIQQQRGVELGLNPAASRLGSAHDSGRNSFSLPRLLRSAACARALASSRFAYLSNPDFSKPNVPRTDPARSNFSEPGFSKSGGRRNAKCERRNRGADAASSCASSPDSVHRNCGATETNNTEARRPQEERDGRSFNRLSTLEVGQGSGTCGDHEHGRIGECYPIEPISIGSATLWTAKPNSVEPGTVQKCRV